MTWSDLDWAALDRLRDGFLHGGAAAGPYWKSPDDLASYDFTYGERIGWKWDHVLRELRLRGWRPAARDVMDWGCGSGVAARRVIDFFGVDQFDTLTVWDHSPAACAFAAERARRAFPALRVTTATPGFLAGDAPLGLLLVSHVLNELSPTDLAALRKLVVRAESVLWVEPGTHAISRQLGGIRDDLVARGEYRVVAPCTHQLACPALKPGHERDWCHFFAPPPSEIFATPDWVKFGQRAGIDLRSLPYAFFAVEKVAAREGGSSEAASESISSHGTENSDALSAPELSRIIGRPEHFKPYARWLNCDATGLNELELPKRADPALYKQLELTKAPLVYRWKREGLKVTGGDPLT
jgi:SAM-dependent methyltransferase